VAASVAGRRCALSPPEPVFLDLIYPGPAGNCAGAQGVAIIRPGGWETVVGWVSDDALCIHGASGLGSEGHQALKGELHVGSSPLPPPLPPNHETAVSGVFSAVAQTSLAVSSNKIV
jgi:hypothetical protein